MRNKNPQPIIFLQDFLEPYGSLAELSEFRIWVMYFLYIGSFEIEVPYLPSADAVPLHIGKAGF